MIYLLSGFQRGATTKCQRLWGWKALFLSLPGAMLIILGQKTVFGDRRRGDYTMQNGGRANPYEKVLVYSWGEVFFMMGWILICWGAAMP